MATDWRDLAACAGMDTELFYGTGASVHTAKKICGLCEVRWQCLAYALSMESPSRTYGVFGGLSAQRRDRMLRGRRGSLDRDCEQCGEAYQARHSTQRYCCRGCAHAAKRASQAAWQRRREEVAV